VINLQVVQRALRVILIASFAVVSGCGANTAGSSGTVDDGSTNTVVAAPPAAQTPPPTTVTVTAPVVSPNGIAGEKDIADNFDIQTTLVPTGETVPASADPVGAFRFPCLGGQLLKDDPIVYPGQPGKSHLHQFFGNLGANANSTYQSLRTTGGSTCTRTASSTDPTSQRSAYWMPAMLDGAGNAVKAEAMNTYYKALPRSNPACTAAPDATHIGFCVPFPNGLRFIIGYNMANGTGGPTDTNSVDQWKMGFDCYGHGPGTPGDAYDGGLKPTLAALAATGKCPVGAWLRVFLVFPDCWDGKNLDSPDHRSHVAFGDGALIDSFKRACPASHPYNIPEIALQIFFTTDANFEAGKWHLSSDEMMAGTVAGSTLHADYWEAWSPVVKNMWQTGCIDGHLSCNVGELGNGQTVKGMQQVGDWPSHVLVPLSSIP
jgi:hypothetical protein